MRVRSLLIIGVGTIAAAALAQAGPAPVEPKTTPNIQAPTGGATPAPAATPAPGAEPRTASPANGTAPIEPKR